MFAPLSDISFTADGLHFPAYPFPPATVCGGATLPWAQVEALLPSRTPPELWTRAGEILFVPAPQRDALAAEAARHGVPSTDAVDVWDLLLEPFLDTWFDEKHQAWSLATLAAQGIAPAEAQALRDRCAAPMIAYNFDTGLWDWVHLGLYDLLQAHWLFRKRFGLSDADLAALYWETIAIARRARLES